MNKLLTGIPSLVGVVLGIWLYSAGSTIYWLYVLAAFIVSLVLLKLGHYVIKRTPRIGLILIETWIVSSICIVGLATALIVWLTINSPSWFNVSTGEVDAVTGAFIGAITAYLASAWTDDIADASGVFWPSTQIKKAFLKFELTGDTLEREAAQDERVHNQDIEGWGVIACWKRAGILANHINKGRKDEANKSE